MDLLTLSALCTFLLCLWQLVHLQRRHWVVDYSAVALMLALTSAQVIACASLRPQIQEARDDFVLACRKLTAAMVGDAAPSKAERIASDVCLVEQMGEKIEHAIAKDTGAPDLFTRDVPSFADPPLDEPPPSPPAK
jgi:hypothetical protein